MKAFPFSVGGSMVYYRKDWNCRGKDKKIIANHQKNTKNVIIKVTPCLTPCLAPCYPGVLFIFCIYMWAQRCLTPLRRPIAPFTSAMAMWSRVHSQVCSTNGQMGSSQKHYGLFT